VLYESNAISRYIAAKARSPLVPAAGDLRANARFDQALSVEQSRIDATIQPLLFQRVWTPRFTGAAADEARVQELAQTLEKRLAAYDAILGRQRYLAGESVTVVDLNHLSFGVYLAPQGFTWLEDKEKFPNVARYVGRRLRREE
jgi:glutathione S-transferase